MMSYWSRAAQWGIENAAYTAAQWAAATGLSVTALVLFILIIRRPFKSVFGAKATYALWVLPAIRLVLPARTEIIPVPEPNYQTLSLPDGFAAQAATETPSFIQLLGQVMPFAVMIWIFGAALYLSVIIWQSYRFRADVMKNSDEVSGSESCLFQRALKHCGFETSKVTLRQSRERVGPLVTGTLNPVIIIPSDFSQRLTPRQQYLAILHEVLHVKRGDLWAASAMVVFRAVNWPNPLIHYAARLFRLDQESACDAQLLQMLSRISGKRGVADYAETLLQASTLAPSHRPHLAPMATLTLTHPLKERLMNIRDIPNQTLRQIGGGVSAAVIIGLCAATWPVQYASAHPDETELAGKPAVRKSVKQISRFHDISDENGVKTESKYEIQIEDGEIKAFKIDPETGLKTAIDPKEIKRFDIETEGANQFHWTGPGKKRIQILRSPNFPDGLDAPRPPMPPSTFFGSGDESVIILDSHNLSGDGFGYVFGSDSADMDAKVTESMVKAARELLEQANADTGKDLSPKAKRKLEAARKALKEAQEALED